MSLIDVLHFSNDPLLLPLYSLSLPLTPDDSKNCKNIDVGTIFHFFFFFLAFIEINQ